MLTFYAPTTTFVNDFGDTSPKVPCNYTFTTQRRLTVGGRILPMREQTYKINILSPGRSALKFPHNYILSTILNESQNYPRPVIVCCCSGKDAIT